MRYFGPGGEAHRSRGDLLEVAEREVIRTRLAGAPAWNARRVPCGRADLDPRHHADRAGLFLAGVVAVVLPRRWVSTCPPVSGVIDADAAHSTSSPGRGPITVRPTR